MMLMWHPGEQVTGQGRNFWSVASQNLDLTHIGYYEQDSICTPYGTDGTHLYQLFAQPDPTLLKRLMTKIVRGGQTQQMLTIKNFKRLFAEFWDNSGQGVSITGSSTTVGAVPGGTESFGFQGTPGAALSIEAVPLTGAGLGIGLDIQSKSPDFTIERLHIAAEERTLWGA